MSFIPGDRILPVLQGYFALKGLNPNQLRNMQLVSKALWSNLGLVAGSRHGDALRNRLFGLHGKAAPTFRPSFVTLSLLQVIKVPRTNCYAANVCFLGDLGADSSQFVIQPHARCIQTQDPIIVWLHWQMKWIMLEVPCIISLLLPHMSDCRLVVAGNLQVSTRILKIICNVWAKLSCMMSNNYMIYSVNFKRFKAFRW